MKKISLIALVSLFALTACNTFEGLGKDVGQAGEGLATAAQKTKEKINGK